MVAGGIGYYLKKPQISQMAQIKGTNSPSVQSVSSVAKKPPPNLRGGLIVKTRPAGTTAVLDGVENQKSPAAFTGLKPGEHAQISSTPTGAVRWTNNLGMVFVPVPGRKVLFSIWDTRVQDYQVFASEKSRKWPKPDFEQGPTHPAVNVS